MSEREINLYEAYQADPEAADATLWGRTTDPTTRRGFLTGLGVLAAALGVSRIPFAGNMPGGLIPAAFAEEPGGTTIPGKDGLIVLNDRPINAETPVALLDPDVTPTASHFVRNNGLVPERAEKMDLEGWTLTIDGAVGQSLTLTMDDLAKYEIVERQLVLECGGNGRAGFNPPAKGNQWTLGAVGCAVYRGVRLRDVLSDAGVKKEAVYVAYEGEDLHLSRDPNKKPISRGVPIAKALDEGTLLAFEMNGEPLPALHGFPLRLLAPGFPASASGKWLQRLWVRDVVHDGPKMEAPSYRVPKHPVKPGDSVKPEDMKIIEEMPVKSIITRPGTGVEAKAGEAVAFRGHAWSGHGDVRSMDVSIDFGATWIPATLSKARNRWAWQHWTADVTFPTAGYYEVWARATDATGASQPMVVPGWNPKGYLNNAMHRVAVKVS